MGLGLVAVFHLAAGALSLGVVSRRLRRTKVMRETVMEVRRSVRAMAHPIEGQAP
jgi:hypothetical protein